MRHFTDEELIGLAALKKKGAACPDQQKVREHFKECNECYEKFCVSYTMMDLANLSAPERLDVLTSDMVFEDYEMEQPLSDQNVQIQDN